MGQVVTVARSLYGRVLYSLLFPFVFLITLLSEGPEHWRDGVIKSAGFVVLMGLGLYTVSVIHHGI